MKKFLLVFLMIAILFCGGCKQEKPADTPTTEQTQTTAQQELPKEGWITADSMRVRGGAGLIYEVIGGMQYGEKVTILGKSGDWYQIQFADTVGYVSGQYLTFEKPAA
jgi:N-acetylmuramoyl-L-alanine amidase